MDGRALPPGLAAGLDLQKVGMFGFSLGGYATANMLLEDQRFAAGLDLDGTLQDDPEKGPLGLVARKGLDQPFLLFGSDTSQRTDVGKEYYDKSWAGFWEAQRGWKRPLTTVVMPDTPRLWTDGVPSGSRGADGDGFRRARWRRRDAR